jgi:hypothetical protein
MVDICLPHPRMRSEGKKENQESWQSGKKRDDREYDLVCEMERTRKRECVSTIPASFRTAIIKVVKVFVMEATLTVESIVGGSFQVPSHCWFEEEEEEEDDDDDEEEEEEGQNGFLLP